jgi:hypothetical protein
MDMKVVVNDPPRTFGVGQDDHIQLKDCAHIALDADEQITLTTDSGGEFDVVRKSWGFYATPSLNRRLPSFGLRPVLLKSPGDIYYVLLVEQGKEAEFDEYVVKEKQVIVAWLDTTESLQALEVQRGKYAR